MAVTKKNRTLLWIMVIGLPIFVMLILPNIPNSTEYTATTGSDGFNWTQKREELSEYSAAIATVITFYLISINTTMGDIFKSIKILFIDFRFSFFLVKEIITWVYAIGMIAFLNYAIKGIVLENGGMIGWSIAIFLIFRILLELCVTSFTTAENTSLIAKNTKRQ